MRIRLGILLLAGANALPSESALSQQVGLAAGYVRMPGRIGEFNSDHGFAARLGVYLGESSLIGVGFEVGYDRLNEVFHQSSDPNCLLPGGGAGTCTFQSWNRDMGLSASVIARLQARVGKTRPYMLAGIGVLSVREYSRSEVRDANGNRLPNFEFDGSSTDGAGLGHLGAGIVVSPGQGRPALTLEGRTTMLLHNYSGGMQFDVSPSIVVGVRMGL